MAIVVPVFNESDRVLSSAPALLEFVTSQPSGSELIWVDDGSTDGTPALVRSVLGQRVDVPARLITRPHRGKGGAVQAGILAANADYVGFCDVDLATPLADLANIVRVARERKVLAIGSRALPQSTILHHEHWTREFLGRSFNRLMRMSLVPGVMDTQCGAKAAPRDIWRRILPYCHRTGFEWDVEVLSVARALGIEIEEIAIRWRHDDRSRFRVLRDGMTMLAALPRIRASARAALKHSTG